MRRREDENTRYYVDVDLATRKVLGWDFGQRNQLAVQELVKPAHHRIFITRGQYNKLEDHAALLNTTAEEA